MTKEFSCLKCPYKTENATQFIDHLSTYHPKEAKYILLKLLDTGKIKIEVT